MSIVPRTLMILGRVSACLSAFFSSVGVETVKTSAAAADAPPLVPPPWLAQPSAGAT